jgi:aminopeptidase YwaD
MSSHTGITDADVDKAIGFTQKVIDECGARLPGSENSLKAANMFYEEMKKEGFEDAKKDNFKFAPEAFFGFFDIIVGSFLLATLFTFLGGNWLYLSTGLLTIGTLSAISQFVYYWGWFDIFYKKKDGCNTIGVINPANPADVKQEIIVCGHHDSAWVVNFFLRWQKLYSIRLIVGIGFILVAYALTLILTIVYAATGITNVPFLTDFVKYGSLVGFFFTIPLLWYRDHKKGAIGAGDNLISCSMALQIGKIFNDAKKAGHPLLKYTRVRVITFDGEEAALKGSKAYVKTHKQELLSIPTIALCPDCIYKMKDFKIVAGDQNGTIKVPQKLVDEVVAVANQLGYKTKGFPWPFGGGASDTASFLKIGVPAITLMGMSTDLIREGLVQHTQQDVVSAIDREIVDVVMKIQFEYILKKEKELNP